MLLSDITYEFFGKSRVGVVMTNVDHINRGNATYRYIRTTKTRLSPLNSVNVAASKESITIYLSIISFPDITWRFTLQDIDKNVRNLGQKVITYIIARLGCGPMRTRTRM